MQKTSKKTVLKYIQDEKPFHAICDGFELEVKEYVPSIATAIHDGHLFSTKLSDYISLSPEERFVEEDPYTSEIISSQAIRMIGRDSRYEYDLNRNLSDCIYKEAWGKEIWKPKTPRSLLDKSLSKHRDFFQVLYALIIKLEQIHDACVIYDIHSYNYGRIKGETPDLNLGTNYFKQNKWLADIRRFESILAQSSIQGRKILYGRNKVFQGKGYLAQFVSEHFDKSLVMPIEFKKIFMNEETGEVYPVVMSDLKECFKSVMNEHAQSYALRHSKIFKRRNMSVMHSDMEKIVLEVDHHYSKISRNIEILNYVNPVNLNQERVNFFKSHYKSEINFKYKHLTIDPYQFREKLYKLPVNKIQDVSLQRMYQQCIDAMASKINLISELGTDHFLYNSLICYGEPNEIDMNNSEYLMYAPDFDQGDSVEKYGVDDAKFFFEKSMGEYGFDYKVVESKKIVAGAMVDNVRECILINPYRKWSFMELNALVYHELGVHALTTKNAKLNTLQLLQIGMPGNTETQEGLAILNEFQSGNLTLKRIKTLALRNIAIYKMLKGMSFNNLFEFIVEEYHIDENDAFNLVARVYRGGGFTKDHLYLKGFRKALSYIDQGVDISNLYVGKTSFRYLELLDELVDRDLVNKPRFLPSFISQPSKTSEITNYLIRSIKESKHSDAFYD